MTQEAPRPPEENWGFNDPGDEELSLGLIPDEAERPRLSPPIAEAVENSFPGAITEIKVDLRNVASPDAEKVQRLGHGLADSQGVKVTVWSDRSNFSVYKPGSDGSTE